MACLYRDLSQGFFPRRRARITCSRFSHDSHARSRPLSSPALTKRLPKQLFFFCLCAAAGCWLLAATLTLTLSLTFSLCPALPTFHCPPCSLCPFDSPSTPSSQSSAVSSKLKIYYIVLGTVYHYYLLAVSHQISLLTKLIINNVWFRCFR